MDNRLFNSSFEMGLRMLLLLSVIRRRPVSVDRIIALDFITCYSADFNLPYVNLHGQNDYRYGELSSRRMLAQKAVKDLVTKGLLDVKVDKGYLFSISEQGRSYVRGFDNSYAKDYLEIAKSAIEKYKKESDESIMNLIQDHSLKAIRGER